MIDQSQIIDWRDSPVTKAFLKALEELKSIHEDSILTMNVLEGNAEKLHAFHRGVIEGIKYALDYEVITTEVDEIDE